MGNTQRSKGENRELERFLVQNSKFPPTNKLKKIIQESKRSGTPFEDLELVVLCRYNDHGLKLMAPLKWTLKSLSLSTP